MQTVVVLGAGNVASHLIKALIQNTYQVKQIYNRTLSKAEELGELYGISATNTASEIEKADLYLIASSDQAIAEIAEKIPETDGMIVHTSGAMPLTEIKSGVRRGVIYPLQTLSKGKNIAYDDMPFFIEAETAEDEALLHTFVRKISHKVDILDSEKRLKIHMAAVWVNNFSNLMFQVGEKFCIENELPFESLKPLIKETAAKLEEMSPYEAQTGPAKRADQETIKKHLKIIKDPDLKKVYELLSQLITKIHA